MKPFVQLEGALRLPSPIRPSTARGLTISHGVEHHPMTTIGFLSVAPVSEHSMASEVAAAVEALDEFPVSYETTPTGTTIEAETPAELFAAAEAAHEAVDGDRVTTVLKVDDMRTADTEAAEMVAAVESELGREARSDR